MRPAPKLLVRKSRATDHCALREILHDTYESTWLPNVTPNAARAFRDEDRPAQYVAARQAEFWVAEKDGVLVGFVDWEGDFVNALHVRSNHARTGIGGLLMDTAEYRISAAGFAAVRLETDTFNVRSQSFYAARGYKEADRYPDTEWDSGIITILLMKAL